MRARDAARKAAPGTPERRLRDNLNASGNALLDEVLAAHTTPTLSESECQFLTFALDQAAEEMTLRDGFTEADTSALEKFRSWAGEER